MASPLMRKQKCVRPAAAGSSSDRRSESDAAAAAPPRAAGSEGAAPFPAKRYRSQSKADPVRFVALLTSFHGGGARGLTAEDVTEEPDSFMTRLSEQLSHHPTSRKSSLFFTSLRLLCRRLEKRSAIDANMTPHTGCWKRQESDGVMMSPSTLLVVNMSFLVQQGPRLPLHWIQLLQRNPRRSQNIVAPTGPGSPPGGTDQEPLRITSSSWTSSNWTGTSWTSPNCTSPNWTNPNWTNPNWTCTIWTLSADKCYHDSFALLHKSPALN
ncbi:uncharacterized protein LOC122821997 [Gambusia affinis]|uniref:uncharacterized protein LOC122821997 n=1 Tax=Gambusia affinis TaxID=33528 RepID=UPI001CDD06C5|nr:uncharacterized protein LOC122821997 [Gambusia affinis]